MLPDVSPFTFGATVSSTSFANRKEEIRLLKQHFTSGTNTILISPRRWGKSSLVERVCNELERKPGSLRIVRLDFFTVASQQELLEQFARAVLRASHTRWEVWWKDASELLARLVPKLEVSPDPGRSVSMSLDWKALDRHPEDVLNLPEKLAQQKNMDFLICIDEFQNIAALPAYEALEKKLRSHWQRHKRVTYCLYGSKRHMMTEIFDSPSKPFYRFGQLMMLGKIERSEWIPFLTERFKSAGKTLGESEAGLIADLMRNHPWYVQQLAHYTFYQTKRKATRAEVMAALREVVLGNAPFYEKQTEMLSFTQINLLKAVAAGETRLTGAETMLTYRLGTPRNVQKNKYTLINNDLVDEHDGGYELLDPGFEIWFRMRFLEERPPWEAP